MGLVATILRLVKGTPLTNAEVDQNFTNLSDGLTDVARDFYGTVDPATKPGITVAAGMRWADSAAGLIKRRNATNDGWVDEGDLFKRPSGGGGESALTLYTEATIPEVDVGLIYVRGIGLMDWNIDGEYAPVAARASGGGMNKIFYENDQVVTAGYTVESGVNAMSAGPITIADGIMVDIQDGGVWTII